MYIQWKTLIGLGFVFWVLLCATDVLSSRKNIDQSESYEKENQQDSIRKDENEAPIKQTNIKFVVSLLMWNLITFGFSFYFCAFIKRVSYNIWKVYTYLKNQENIQNSVNQEVKRGTSNSRIPILISRSSIRLQKNDDDELIELKKTKSSCPNLLLYKKPEEIEKPLNCRTIFKNDSLFSSCLRNRFKMSLENRCAKLREEVLQIQANSLKEHTALSKQLESINKDKKELSKQLSISQKENRAAKQQLEELLQEKFLLHQRLESATIEFRNNTKTKKIALSKLEEVTCNVDHLKMQLEQVTRDKEILENKLKILQDEYEKLQDRITVFNIQPRIDQDTPVRDDNRQNSQQIEVDNLLPVSVSQTELDMKKVQLKIDILEQNLKNFIPQNPLPNMSSISEQDNALWHTDISSARDEDETSFSQTDGNSETPESLPESPRHCWCKPYNIKNIPSKIPLSSKLSSIGSVLESTTGTNGESLETVDDLSEDTQAEGRRIVSSSVAFQKFLKNLSHTESSKSYFSLSSVNFNT